MQPLGPITVTASGGRHAFAAALDTAHIVQRVASVSEARRLPRGTMVGDVHGGLTFSDEVAAVLERRSRRGWHEIETPSGDVWTVIVVDR
jgi:hypothetical protein